MSATLEGIRAVKLLAWEGFMLQQIGEARRKELVHLRSFLIISMLNYLFLTMTPIIIAAGTFCV